MPVRVIAEPCGRSNQNGQIILPVCPRREIPFEDFREETFSFQRTHKAMLVASPTSRLEI